MRKLTSAERDLLLGTNEIIAAEKAFCALPPGPAQDAAIQRYNTVLIDMVEQWLARPLPGATPEARAVKVRPTRKEPGMRVQDQYLEVVLPDGQVLPEVTKVVFEEEVGYLNKVTVSMWCGGILPAEEA